MIIYIYLYDFDRVFYDFDTIAQTPKHNWATIFFLLSIVDSLNYEYNGESLNIWLLLDRLTNCYFSVWYLLPVIVKFGLVSKNAINFVDDFILKLKLQK